MNGQRVYGMMIDTWWIMLLDRLAAYLLHLLLVALDNSNIKDIMVVFHIPQKLEKLCGDTFSCKNGSVCKPGDGSEVDHQHQHLNLVSSVTSHVDGSSYYCECPPGYIGHDCSVEVKECTSHREDLVHSCYFGSECIVADNEYGLLDKFCDCSRVHTEDGKFVAGLMCQYTSSTMCVDYDADFVSTTDAYCTNGGTCQSIVGPDEDFPGCFCENGKWDGKHCEFEEGVLKDDALDLFSYRKAEILYEENLHGLGLGMTTSTTSDARVEIENFNFTMFGLGFGVVFTVGISLLMLLVARSRVRHEKGQLVPEDDYNCFVYDGQAPPPNVFSSSRKKEVEGEDDDESVMKFGNEHDVKHEDSVEILDEVTSRILESQFSRTEIGGAHSKEEELGEDISSTSYYDCEDERLDGKGLSRITINSGQFPLSPIADEQSLPMRSIMSLDGDDDDDVDDSEHSNIMSLDGSYSEDEDDASNYRIISYV